MIGGIIILLFISIILLLALLAITISKRSGLPSLLLFLSLGIICNFLGINFNNYEITEGFSKIALLIIIFYGGFGTNWKMGKKVVKEAILLSSLGVITTAMLLGFFIHFVLDVPLIESFLLGSIVSSTDFASVFNILSSKNLNLKYNTASLLELESGSNDPMAYTLTIIFLSMLSGGEVSPVFLLAKQVFIGLACGFLIAYGISVLINKIDLQKDGLINIFIFAMAIFTYALTEFLTGNGYLSIYILGIYIGNKTFIAKKDVIFFFDGISDLMNIALFFILGLLSEPTEIVQNLPFAIIIMIFLTIVARPLSVFSILAFFKVKKEQLLTVSWAGLRGAAAITFAILAINNNFNFSIDIYHIVLGICLLSSLIQGTLMPIISKWLNMVDPNNTVLRTFNYYSGKGNITFMKSVVSKNSRLANKPLKDASVERDFIIAKVIRKNKSLVPKGSLILKPGDILIWSGEEYFDPMGHNLIEFSISEGHVFANKKIMDLHLPKSQLIISINRNDRIIPAVGRTKLIVGDRVLLFKK